MIKFIKKHKYKLLSIMLTIVSVFTLFLGINKTYAYDTNQLSYTIELYSDSNFTNQIISQNVGNYNGVLIDKSIINSNQQFIYFKMKNNTTYTKKYYFLMNWGYWNGNDWDWTLSNKQINLNIYNNDKTLQQSNYNLGGINNNGNYLTYPYFNTFIARNINTSDNNNYIYGSLNMNNYTSSYDLFIQNIDIVSVEDIGISQYYDTFYGQIEDNYNSLLSDYNTLQDNYNTLLNNYNSLQSQLDSLQTTYDNLMLSYNALESDYDTLQANYRTLNTNFNDLYYRYEQLESDYNNLQDTLDNLPNYNGIQSFIDSFNGATLKLTGYAGLGPIPSAPTYTLENFDNSNFNLSRDTDSFYTWIQNNINTYGGFDLYITLSVPYTTSLSASFSNVNYNHELSIYSQIDGLSVADYSTSNVGSSIIINENNNYSIIQIRMSLTQQDYDFILSSNTFGDQYMSGYNSGYNQSLREWNSELNTARNTIESQKNTIRTLQSQLNTASQYDLNKLMWTIASTPFESFKQIWNVDFFGVNISTMITGFLTGIIVIWIIKKFFL